MTKIERIFWKEKQDALAENTRQVTEQVTEKVTNNLIFDLVSRGDLKKEIGMQYIGMDENTFSSKLAEYEKANV